MAAVLRGSRFLVGRCCKHVGSSFGKRKTRRVRTRRARRCASCKAQAVTRRAFVA